MSANERLLLYADELTGRTKKGDKISIDGRQGIVEFANNEWNEDNSFFLLKKVGRFFGGGFGAWKMHMLLVTNQIHH